MIMDDRIATPAGFEISVKLSEFLPFQLFVASPVPSKAVQIISNPISAISSAVNWDKPRTLPNPMSEGGFPLSRTQLRNSLARFS